MGMIDDIMKALDRWDIWRDVQKLPAKSEALERRVADIEQKLGSKWPPDVCKYCGERAVRLNTDRVPDDKGKVHQVWHCTACDKYENRITKP